VLHLHPTALPRSHLLIPHPVTYALPCVLPPALYYFAKSFLLWSVFQASVMFVQNRYQRRRMYTRIALGKNTAMDVVSGESSGSSGQLLLLYPLLFSKLRRRCAHCACAAPDAPCTPPSVATETLPLLLLLLSLCTVLQGWQLYIGVNFTLKTWPALVDSEGWLEQERCQSDLRGMRGTFVCGVIFSFLAVMNCINTIATITEKRSQTASGARGGGSRRR
jgi:TMPIT-like protein